METDSGNAHCVTKLRRLKKYNKKVRGQGTAYIMPNFADLLKEFLYDLVRHIVEFRMKIK